MRLSHILSRDQWPSQLSYRQQLPWIVSPLDLDTAPTSSEHDPAGPGTKHASATTAVRPEQLQPHIDPDLPRFKHHHESSTVELFYDLFFVANLATFTANHEIVNTDSLKNYVGFFTILWFTWLETSLFDVRFATNSVFTRLCKAISFGVMTGFAVCGASYGRHDINVLRLLSILLMISRLTLATQYGVVLLYARKYPRTLLPLLLTIVILSVSAVAFLGTFWVHDPEGVKTKAYIIHYVVSCVEATAIITVSCTWRFVSFRHTHLVERIGLLSLIIMGEGILGITKSLSKIFQNVNSVASDDVGVLVSSVLLIYFIWILYFDQIDHDRFGTIRQQIWALIHFPLHVALVLTATGIATMIPINIIIGLSNEWYHLWYDLYSSEDDNGQLIIKPTVNASSPQEFIDLITPNITEFERHFKKATFKEDAFDYREHILNIKSEFGSQSWSDEASSILYYFWIDVGSLIFKKCGIELPDEESSKKDIFKENDALFNVFDIAITYFYIAAGALLVILAIMYWFGKTKKSRDEWASIALRLLAGMALW